METGCIHQGAAGVDRIRTCAFDLTPFYLEELGKDLCNGAPCSSGQTCSYSQGRKEHPPVGYPDRQGPHCTNSFEDGSKAYI